MNDIIKIMNNNKSKKKIVSPSKKEIVLIQKYENGKTMRCIKKRCKDRNKKNTTSIKENENDKNESVVIDKEKDINNEEKNNEKEDDNNKILDNNTEKYNKEENKIIELKVSEQQIEALRRIKLTLANIKSQKKMRNISNKTLKKCNSFAFLNIIRFIKNLSEISRLNSGKINSKRNKLYDYISN